MKYVCLTLVVFFYFTKGQELECGPHEIAKNCTSSCDLSSKNTPPRIRPRACLTICVKQCDCDEENGYIRSNGTCIKKQEYRHARSVTDVCPTNQANVCTSPCHPIPTCQNRHPVPPPWSCGGLCIRQCECDFEKGYIKNEKNGQCVEENECPSS